jgi:hypothetical protein
MHEGEWMAKVIEAQRAGTCPICGHEYDAGTRIAKDKETGKWAEADCIWPKSKKDHAQARDPSQNPGGENDRRTSPRGGGTDHTERSLGAASPEEIIVRVQSRMDAAISMVEAKFPGTPRPVLIPYIVEKDHQLFAEETTEAIQSGADRRAKGIR